MALGITNCLCDALPTTAYLLQYSINGCSASCTYCPQSRSSRSRRDLLSRVIWPEVDLDVISKKLPHCSMLRRVCVQTVIKRDFINELVDILLNISSINKHISTAITPVPRNVLIELISHGVDHLGVGLDASSKELFMKVKKPYTWRKYWRFIHEAVKVFGDWNVTVHLIVGLGEGINDLIDTIRRIKSLNANVALFAFTPIKGTELGSLRNYPNIMYYRLVQLITKLIYDGHNPSDFLLVSRGKAFVKRDFISYDSDFLRELLLTRGCPYCNRPFYNEVPGKELYNFPNEELIMKYKDLIIHELERMVHEGVKIV